MRERQPRTECLELLDGVLDRDPLGGGQRVAFGLGLGQIFHCPYDRTISHLISRPTPGMPASARKRPGKRQRGDAWQDPCASRQEPGDCSGRSLSAGPVQNQRSGTPGHEMRSHRRQPGAIHHRQPDSDITTADACITPREEIPGPRDDRSADGRHEIRGRPVDRRQVRHRSGVDPTRRPARHYQPLGGHALGRTGNRPASPTSRGAECADEATATVRLSSLAAVVARTLIEPKPTGLTAPAPPTLPGPPLALFRQAARSHGAVRMRLGGGVPDSAAGWS